MSAEIFAEDDAVRPVDLELRVIIASGDSREIALEYKIHSPSGAVDLFHQTVRGPRLHKSSEFKAYLLEQLSRLSSNFVSIDGNLLLAEYEDELSALGRDLYQELFSPGLRDIYRRIRNRVTTLQIISDDLWIPWELVRPFDDSNPTASFDDDFLCVRFQLTRWLAGSMSPAGRMQVNRMAAIEARGSSGRAHPLGASKEYTLLTELVGGAPGVENVSLSEATFRQLEDLLEGGGLGLMHFVCHGDPGLEQTSELKLELADRPFRARYLAGPAQLRLKVDRPLVFFSVCRAERQARWLTGLDGWAERWVRGCGCGAFIGSQWAVDDRSALRFVQLFYRQLREGRTLGEATQLARRTVRQEMPGSLSWLAYSVFAHPNARLDLGAKAPGIEVSRASTSAEIRKGIRDFGRFIADKTGGFVGRQWLFSRIEEFLVQQPRGYLLLSGDPGIGKSALLAELVRRKGFVHHFNIRAEGVNRAEDFLSNVCSQLIVAYDLPHNSLPEEATRDGGFFHRLLCEVSSDRPKEKIVIVVDALDEAAPVLEGANPLYLPLTVPPGVYIIASTRRGIKLQIQCEMEELEIQQDEAGNLADVRAFVESKLENPGIRAYIGSQELREEAFVTQMVEKSQGNLMYLRYILPDIDRGLYKDNVLEVLPKGLQNYFEEHWRRMRSRDEEAWLTYQLPVLVALTVVKEPVSIDLIGDFSGVEDRLWIRRVLVEWEQFLHKEVIGDDTGQRQIRYRLYHETFYYFITAKDEVADERVDLKSAHGRIADVLWRELYPDG